MLPPRVPSLLAVFFACLCVCACVCVDTIDSNSSLSGEGQVYEWDTQQPHDSEKHLPVFSSVILSVSAKLFTRFSRVKD